MAESQGDLESAIVIHREAIQIATQLREIGRKNHFAESIERQFKGKK